MIIFRLLDSLILWIYGFFIIYFDLKNWNNSKKVIKDKISELIYGFAYILNGLILYFIFGWNNLNEQSQNYIYALLFFVFISILLFLWIFNIIPTKIKIKKHPELLKEDAKLLRIPDLYFKKVENEYQKNESKDIIRDISRKLLHLLVLVIVVFGHEYTKSIESKLISIGLNSLAMRNFIYYSIAFFFLLMFSTADLIRNNKFELLPDWALKWYSKSLELKTERYTFISSVPFLLSLLLLAPFNNFTIIIVPTLVSCISDSAASIIGKNFGTHKFMKIGNYPNKSIEGTIAGCLTSFLGTFLAFEVYPISNITFISQVLISIFVGCAFFYTDVFSKYVVDNVLNVILPAIIMVLFVYFI